MTTGALSRTTEAGSELVRRTLGCTVVVVVVVFVVVAR